MPRVIKLELLAKIAVLVDYYDCFEVVAVFSETWIRNLGKDEDELPLYCRDLLLRLFVSWCFGPKDVLCRLKHTVLKQSRGPLHQLNLPFPVSLVG